MAGIESAERGVVASPAAIDPGLGPRVRHEHVIRLVKTRCVGEAIDNAGRDARCAPQSREQYRMFGAVAFRFVKDLERRGIADAQ